MPTQRVGCAQQGIDQLRRELLRVADAVEHVFDRVGQHLDLLERQHPRRALDRMRVTEKGVEGVGHGPAGLECEQRLDHVVEPFDGFVAEELEELDAFAHPAPTSTAANTLPTSRMPTRCSSAMVDPDRKGDWAL